MSAPAARTRLAYSTGAAIAESLVDLLAPSCERLQVCGSIRRRAETIGDIDLVAVPKLSPIVGLFEGPPSGHVNVLNHQLDELCGQQVIRQARRADGKIAGWGDKLRKFVYRGLPVQCRQATAETFGMVVLIATGPASYSHAFVTPRSQQAALRNHDGTVIAYRQGLLPAGFSVASGFVLHFAHQPISTPDEAAVFEALGWAYLDPWERR